jgi:acyl carrier protein
MKDTDNIVLLAIANALEKECVTQVDPSTKVDMSTLEAIELIMKIERTLDVKIHDDEVQDVTNLQMLIEYLEAEEAVTA